MEYIFVDKEIVIDGPFNENCILQFETQEDRILAFSVLDGDIKETENFLSVSKIDFIMLSRLLANGYIIIFVRFMTVSTARLPFSL